MITIERDQGNQVQSLSYDDYGIYRHGQVHKQLFVLEDQISISYTIEITISVSHRFMHMDPTKH